MSWPDERMKTKNPSPRFRFLQIRCMCHNKNWARPHVCPILYRDHVPLVSIPTFGDVNASLVEGLAVDGPAGCQNLRSHLGRRAEEDGAFAEKGRRVHGCGVAAGVEVDGRGLGEERHDVDVVFDAGGVLW